jgi:hypothetical protein
MVFCVPSSTSGGILTYEVVRSSPYFLLQKSRKASEVFSLSIFVNSSDVWKVPVQNYTIVFSILSSRHFFIITRFVTQFFDTDSLEIEEDWVVIEQVLPQSLK